MCMSGIWQVFYNSKGPAQPPPASSPIFNKRQTAATYRQNIDMMKVLRSDPLPEAVVVWWKQGSNNALMTRMLS